VIDQRGKGNSHRRSPKEGMIPLGEEDKEGLLAASGDSDRARSKQARHRRIEIGEARFFFRGSVKTSTFEKKTEPAVGSR